MQQVGGSGDEITGPAISHIHLEAEGIPRSINKLCDLALVYAASAGSPAVGKPIVNELIRDGLILKPAPPLLVLTNRLDTAERAAE